MSSSPANPLQCRARLSRVDYLYEVLPHLTPVFAWETSATAYSDTTSTAKDKTNVEVKSEVNIFLKSLVSLFQITKSKP